MARLVVEIEYVKKLCVQNVDVIIGSIVNTIVSMGPTITKIEIEILFYFLKLLFLNYN